MIPEDRDRLEEERRVCVVVRAHAEERLVELACLLADEGRKPPAGHWCDGDGFGADLLTRWCRVRSILAYFEGELQQVEFAILDQILGP